MNEVKSPWPPLECTLSLASCRLRAESLARRLHCRLWAGSGFLASFQAAAAAAQDTGDRIKPNSVNGYSGYGLVNGHWCGAHRGWEVRTNEAYDSLDDDDGEEEEEIVVRPPVAVLKPPMNEKHPILRPPGQHTMGSVLLHKKLVRIVDDLEQSDTDYDETSDASSDIARFEEETCPGRLYRGRSFETGLDKIGLSNEDDPISQELSDEESDEDEVYLPAEETSVNGYDVMSSFSAGDVGTSVGRLSSSSSLNFKREVIPEIEEEEEEDEEEDDNTVVSQAAPFKNVHQHLELVTKCDDHIRKRSVLDAESEVSSEISSDEGVECDDENNYVSTEKIISKSGSVGNENHDPLDVSDEEDESEELDLVEEVFTKNTVYETSRGVQPTSSECSNLTVDAGSEESDTDESDGENTLLENDEMDLIKNEECLVNDLEDVTTDQEMTCENKFIEARDHKCFHSSPSSGQSAINEHKEECQSVVGKLGNSYVIFGGRMSQDWEMGDTEIDEQSNLKLSPTSSLNGNDVIRGPGEESGLLGGEAITDESGSFDDGRYENELLENTGEDISSAKHGKPTPCTGTKSDISQEAGCEDEETEEETDEEEEDDDVSETEELECVTSFSKAPTLSRAAAIFGSRISQDVEDEITYQDEADNNGDPTADNENSETHRDQNNDVGTVSYPENLKVKKCERLCENVQTDDVGELSRAPVTFGKRISLEDSDEENDVIANDTEVSKVPKVIGQGDSQEEYENEGEKYEKQNSSEKSTVPVVFGERVSKEEIEGEEEEEEEEKEETDDKMVKDDKDRNLKTPAVFGEILCKEDIEEETDEEEDEEESDTEDEDVNVKIEDEKRSLKLPETPAVFGDRVSKDECEEAEEEEEEEEDNDETEEEDIDNEVENEKEISLEKATVPAVLGERISKEPEKDEDIQYDEGEDEKEEEPKERREKFRERETESGIASVEECSDDTKKDEETDQEPRSSLLFGRRISQDYEEDEENDFLKRNIKISRVLRDLNTLSFSDDEDESKAEDIFCESESYEVYEDDSGNNVILGEELETKHDNFRTPVLFGRRVSVEYEDEKLDDDQEDLLDDSVLSRPVSFGSPIHQTWDDEDDFLVESPVDLQPDNDSNEDECRSLFCTVKFKKREDEESGIDEDAVYETLDDLLAEYSVEEVDDDEMGDGTSRERPIFDDESDNILEKICGVEFTNDDEGQDEASATTPEVIVSNRFKFHVTPVSDQDHLDSLQSDSGEWFQDSQDICKGNRLSSLQYSEDEEDDDRYRRVLWRSTSLKTGKTPPGTPRRKKIVRFADALGLDLEAVRHIVSDDIPVVPASAFMDLKLEPPAPSPSISAPVLFSSRKCLCAQFSQPSADKSFIERLRSQRVCLENVVVEVMDFYGVIRVLNCSFHKCVTVRYTVDEWRSYCDIQASYIEGSSDGFADRFKFSLQMPGLRAGDRVVFAIRFTTDGSEYWDNNDGRDYVLRCMTVSRLDEENDPMDEGLFSFV